MLKNPIAYLYKVTTTEGSVHYEVFRRTMHPVCTDFENKIFSKTEFREGYPRSNAFGVSAWCIKDFDKAKARFEDMNVTIEEYIAAVKEQLECNATPTYKAKFIVYTYTNEQIDNNLKYFKDCLKDNLSSYKALLFFGDILQEDGTVSSK